MKRLRLHSIWPKIFLIIFVFIMLPVLTFTFVANYITEESLMEQKRQSDLRAIHDLEVNLSILADSILDAGALIGQTQEAQAYFGEAKRLREAGALDYLGMDTTDCAVRLASELEHVAALSFMDPSGRFIGEHKLDRGRLSWYFNPTLLQTATTGARFWTDPFTIEYIGSGEEYRVMAALSPVRDAEHELVGYVVLYMNTDAIYELVGKSENEITVLDAAEFVVASRQRVPYYASLYQFRKIAYSCLIADSSVILPVDGRRMVVTTRMYDQLHLRFVMISSFDSISAILDRNYSKLALMMAGGLLFALLAALVLARSFTKPVRGLSDVMAQASAGDLNVRYHGRSRDEIERLGHDFNQFLDTIQQLMTQKIDHQKRKRELQLQLLQEQVQPHFLYNVLEMISSLIQCGMSREALSAIQSLASFYRVSLNKGSDIISVQQEISLSESYLRLQKLRYVEFMDYNLAIDPSILACLIPKLTLQPLIENAIYHGLKGRRTRGIVSVSGAMSGDCVVFEVYDNGVGMGPEQLGALRSMARDPDRADSPHFGLGSVVKRLNIHTGNRALVEIDSEQGSFTSVRLTLPAQRGPIRTEEVR